MKFRLTTWLLLFAVLGLKIGYLIPYFYTTEQSFVHWISEKDRKRLTDVTKPVANYLYKGTQKVAVFIDPYALNFNAAAFQGFSYKFVLFTKGAIISKLPDEALTFIAAHEIAHTYFNHTGIRINRFPTTEQEKEEALAAAYLSRWQEQQSDYFAIHVIHQMGLTCEDAVYPVMDLFVKSSRGHKESLYSSHPHDVTRYRNAKKMCESLERQTQ